MSDEKYEWDNEKRQRNIDERGLDIAVLGPMVLACPNVVVKQDDRQDYGENRYRAFGIVHELRLCVCFTYREDVVRLVTIYKVNRKDWEKHYG